MVTREIDIISIKGEIGVILSSRGLIKKIVKLVYRLILIRFRNAGEKFLK